MCTVQAVQKKMKVCRAEARGHGLDCKQREATQNERAGQEMESDEHYSFLLLVLCSCLCVMGVTEKLKQQKQSSLYVCV